MEYVYVLSLFIIILQRRGLIVYLSFFNCFSMLFKESFNSQF